MPQKPPAPRPPTPLPPTHASLPQWGQREIDGETDGTWYQYPVFQKRCIDVTLVDTKRTVGRTRTYKKQWDCEGKSGYLLPIEWFPLGKMNEKVQVYGLAQGSNKFHPQSIRPRRITDSGDPVERAFGERVIIIGPDATNDESLRGEYALVVTGDAPEEYADVILTDGTSKRYHRTSLCLARNRELEVGPHIFPATAFPTYV